MAVIVPQQDPWEGLGTGLGSGLGGALQALSNLKLQEMMQQRQRAQSALGLAALPGVGQQRAQALASLDPQVLREVVKRELSAPSEQMFAQSLSSLLGGEPMGTQAQSLQQGAQAPMGIQGQGMNIPAGLKPQQALQLAQLGIQQKNLASKQTTEQRRHEHALQKESNKETKEYFNKILGESDAARRGDKRLNRMEELIKKGDLPYSSTYRLFKNLSEAKTHAPIIGSLADLALNALGGLGSALQRNITAKDTEEFEKLSNDFIRDAKNVFGNRITDNDLNFYMSMIPTLMQSDNGKKAVIRNMKSFNKAAVVKADVMKQILKENNGKRPFDLSLQVEERSKPLLDKIAENFKIGLAEQAEI